MASADTIAPVILCGGSGTRLWPMSRENYPKQFLPLLSSRSMLQDTICRVQGIKGIEKPIVVCNEGHRFFVAQQLLECSCEESPVICEPFGRNTAPATALAALLASKMFNDPFLLVLPADHAISEVDSFLRSFEKALPLCRNDYLVTFGAAPYYPETGYGYIRKGEAIDSGEAFRIDKFVEKPDEVTAQKYLEVGNYLWNSGMFLFKASNYLKELSSSNSEIVTTCEAALDSAIDHKPLIIIDPDSFKQCPSDSIDYAVMEKTTKGAVVSLDAGWSDVGSWKALWEICERDEEGNVIQGDVTPIDVSNCYLHSKDRLIAAIGIEDLMIIETQDAVLALHKSRAQDVKAIVEQLKITQHKLLNTHKSYRPWGSYEVLDEGEGFKVKRITVNPGEGISLQKHQHRSEHWIVVKGTALVTCDEKIQRLSENQYAHIPLGAMHRLENPGNVALEIIEAQLGDYLEEDDIIRYEDKYDRIEHR